MNGMSHGRGVVAGADVNCPSKNISGTPEVAWCSSTAPITMR